MCKQGGGREGGGCLGGKGKMNRQTNRPKLICPFNFFEAGANEEVGA